MEIISPFMMVFVVAMAGLAGFIDSIAGGGGIITLPAYLFAGIPPHNAYAINKFAASSGTSLAVINYFKSGAMDLKAALIAAVGSGIGSAIAANIVLLMSEEFLKLFILCVIPVAAIIIFTQKNKPDINRVEPGMSPKKVALAFFIGFIVGGYDGIAGPGTGTFAIIAFSTIMHYDLLTAGGNAKILNLASNLAALVTFLLQGLVIFKIAIPCAIASIVGTQIGSHMALKRGAKFIRPMMLVVVTLMMIKVLFDLIVG